MSRVGQKNTGAEMIMRRALHQKGLRYRLHSRSLAGSPDIVFRRFNAVIFVNGCFWHSHGCYRSTVPKTESAFWIEKFRANRARDKRNYNDLSSAGWRVLIVWECSLRGKVSLPIDSLVNVVIDWLHSSEGFGQVEGAPPAVPTGQNPCSSAAH